MSVTVETTPSGQRRLILTTPPPVVVVTTRGEVRLRHLSAYSQVEMAKLAERRLSDRAFLARVLHLHMEPPRPLYLRFRRWPEVDLDAMALAWAPWDSAFDTILDTEDVAGSFRRAFDVATARWTAQHMAFWSRIRETVDTQIRAHATRLSEAAESITRAAQDHFADLNDRIIDALAHLPPRLRDAYTALASSGWVIDQELDFAYIWPLADLARAGDVTKIDAVMASHYSRRLKAIEADVVRRFPHRKRILQAAFKAHRRKEYELSVPVLLAQADGITSECFGVQLYRRSGERTALAEVVDAGPLSEFSKALVSALSSKSPLNANRAERPDGFTGLNRHQVLHGEATGYATLQNSLKSIAIVNYLTWITSPISE